MFGGGKSGRSGSGIRETSGIGVNCHQKTEGNVVGDFRLPGNQKFINNLTGGRSFGVNQVNISETGVGNMMINDNRLHPGRKSDRLKFRNLVGAGGIKDQEQIKIGRIYLEIILLRYSIYSRKT